MDIRKLFKSGNSLVVALGPESLEWLGLKVGDQVMLQHAPGPKIIVQNVTHKLVHILRDEEVTDGTS